MNLILTGAQRFPGSFFMFFNWNFSFVQGAPILCLIKSLIRDSNPFVKLVEGFLQACLRIMLLMIVVCVLHGVYPF